MHLCDIFIPVTATRFGMGKIDSLPSRPLSEPEIERLNETASEDLVVTPSSVISTEDGGRGITTVIFFRRDEMTWSYLGWNPDIDGWEQFESLEEGEYTQEKSNEIIDEWAREKYGEDEVSHSTVEL
jgi:hypothetical protein